MPNLELVYSSLVDMGLLWPSWRPRTRALRSAMASSGSARHVHASRLSLGVPRSFQASMKHSYPDRDVWVESYREENGGLQDSDTYEVISEEQYQRLRRHHGDAIPSMVVQTVKSVHYLQVFPLGGNCEHQAACLRPEILLVAMTFGRWIRPSDLPDVDSNQCRIELILIVCLRRLVGGVDPADGLRYTLGELRDLGYCL